MNTLDLICRVQKEPFVENPNQAFNEIRLFIQLHQLSHTNDRLRELLLLNFSRKDIKDAIKCYQYEKIN